MYHGGVGTTKRISMETVWGIWATYVDVEAEEVWSIRMREGRDSNRGRGPGLFVHVYPSARQQLTMGKIGSLGFSEARAISQNRSTYKQSVVHT